MALSRFLLLPSCLAFLVLGVPAVSVWAADTGTEDEVPAAAADKVSKEVAGKPADEKPAEEKKDVVASEPEVQAKEEAPAKKETTKSVKPKKAAKKDDGIVAGEKSGENPVKTWIEAENKLIDTLSKDDQRSFYIMRNKYGVIRSVRVVRRDVKAAVFACGKANPDMKDAMSTRFKEWEGSVLPVLDLAEKYLKEEIDTQQVVYASDFRYVLKLNDKAFEYGEKQIEKSPVTDKESCENLVKSMDRTENKMVELLQDMLLPESVIRERAARAEEAEEARKAKAASEKTK